MTLIPPVQSGTQVAAGDLNRFLAAALAQSYSISGAGGVPAVPTPPTLSVSCPAQDLVVNNGASAVFVHAATTILACPASQDIYVDLGYSGATYDGVSANGVWNGVSVANGATAPAVTANALRLWKVVTSGTTITSITLLATTLPVGGGLVQANSAPGVLGVDASGHLTGGYKGGTAPAIAAGSAAGTSPTVSLLSGSTDTYGTINLTCGTAPPSSGTLLTVTFGVAYASAPRTVLVTPSDGTNAVQWFFTVYKQATNFSLFVAATGPAAGQNYHFDYLVLA